LFALICGKLECHCYFSGARSDADWQDMFGVSNLRDLKKRYKMSTKEEYGTGTEAQINSLA